MRTTTPLADVAAAASGPLWMQLYVSEDREATADAVATARRHGYRRVVLTADRQIAGTRPRAQRHGGDHGRPTGRWDASLGWDDLEWVCSLGLPVTLKGVLRGDDARRGLTCGADSVIVSNHGGRQIDGAVPTAVALRDVVASLGGDAPVLVDGGVRSGADVFRALALGAAAVLVGRPMLWGLAVGGRRGVVEVLDHLARGLGEVMSLSGCADVAAITPDMVCRPDGGPWT